MTFPLLQLLAGSLFLIVILIIIPLARRLMRPIAMRLLWGAWA